MVFDATVLFTLHLWGQQVAVEDRAWASGGWVIQSLPSVALQEFPGDARHREVDLMLVAVAHPSFYFSPQVSALFSLVTFFNLRYELQSPEAGLRFTRLPNHPGREKEWNKIKNPLEKSPSSRIIDFNDSLALFWDEKTQINSSRAAITLMRNQPACQRLVF